VVNSKGLESVLVTVKTVDREPGAREICGRQGDGEGEERAAWMTETGRRGMAQQDKDKRINCPREGMFLRKMRGGRKTKSLPQPRSSSVSGGGRGAPQRWPQKRSPTCCACTRSP